MLAGVVAAGMFNDGNVNPGRLKAPTVMLAGVAGLIGTGGNGGNGGTGANAGSPGTGGAGGLLLGQNGLNGLP